jgi:hypothetical protein
LLPFACTQECTVEYLIDREGPPMMVGIGSEQSIGIIHSLPLLVGGVMFTNPFVVSNAEIAMPVLGADWLVKNRAIIDLSTDPGYLVLQHGVAKVPLGRARIGRE